MRRDPFLGKNIDSRVPRAIVLIVPYASRERGLIQLRGRLHPDAGCAEPRDVATPGLNSWVRS